jgi:hypothetical protein
MKIGKDTGSIVNWVTGNSKSVEPQPGMGATLLCWSDRRAYTIHKVTDKKLWASQDEARLIEGSMQSEYQRYKFFNLDASNPSRWSLFTLRKDGRWHQGNTLSGMVLSIGYRDEYYDPTF